MIPRWPYTVNVQLRNGTRPICKTFDTIKSALAMRDEHVGKANVVRVTVTLILDEAHGLNGLVSTQHKE
jgi:hypothetical protein